ncbi:CLUMA_CG013938, isoform A [Clunio marinus]|uniref:CLUMA_CG013938, isoform A n=1 Tax=Clunio marinus TaxID=568069 RepID=A0A1J1INK7_9DIPT|nr:CLUMA_CG013938, isoform A [Clunio marinus]
MSEEVKVQTENGDKKEEVVTDKQEESNEEAKQELNNLTKLEQDIIRQIEYYFSENNLRRDKFMIQKISENEGWIDISTLLTFNRLKAITEDAKAIADAMDKSPNGTVQVSEDREKLRRHPENPLPEFNETRRKEVQSRTAYAKGFPLDSTLSQLIDYFNNNFENVEQVIMRKYFCSKEKKHFFKGSVFVTFSKREYAEEFVNKPELKYKEKNLLRYTQSKYIEIKKQEREEFGKKKKAKKDEAELAELKEQFALPKAAVVHFTGAEGDMSREDIKSRIGEIDSSLEVAFIHFQKGDKEGDLRFNKENAGSQLLEKLDDGKMKVNETELKFTLVEGEDEEKFLEKAISDMKQRRSNFQKGKGKNNFGRKRKHDGRNEGNGKRVKT